MRLGRIVGTVVSTIKSPGLNAYKLLLVRDIDAARPEGTEGTADIYVAVDLSGAGEGDVVLVSHGSAARVGEGHGTIPTDAAVIGIIDTIQAGSTTTYTKH
jgi:microcompartment protein CcmK/EutM